VHKEIEPAIHYWGTPVVVVSTLNEDQTPNLAPMSSAWWLGWSCMLGLDASSQTTVNLRRGGQCVLNLAAVENVAAVDRLARTTGSASVPLHKKALGYRHAADKFGAAGLTAESSVEVAPPRVKEFPVQLEAVVEGMTPFAFRDPRMAVPAVAVEVRIVRAHVAPDLLAEPGGHRVDPERWRPLFMSFRQFYGRGDNAHPSRLAHGSEEAYAPWRAKGVRALAGKAVGLWSRYRYGP